jgi:general secretion pathway protein G
MRIPRLTQIRRAKGFTLIEIMVVVVIIGLLAAIVGPRLLGRVDEARVSAAEADLRSIETALDLYRLDNFRYPSSIEGLQALVTNPGEAAAPNWRQGLTELPMDPWGRPYEYRNPAQRSGREYDLFTYGRDGAEGGEGVDADIGNWTL